MKNYRNKFEEYSLMEMNQFNNIAHIYVIQTIGIIWVTELAYL